MKRLTVTVRKGDRTLTRTLTATAEVERILERVPICDTEGAFMLSDLWSVLSDPAPRGIDTTERLRHYLKRGIGIIVECRKTLARLQDDPSDPMTLHSLLAWLYLLYELCDDNLFCAVETHVEEHFDNK